MRRDINGKLDGNGLKHGDFTEGAVTILGPLVVGKVTSPTRLQSFVYRKLNFQTINKEIICHAKRKYHALQKTQTRV